MAYDDDEKRERKREWKKKEKKTSFMMIRSGHSADSSSSAADSPTFSLQLAEAFTWSGNGKDAMNGASGQCSDCWPDRALCNCGNDRHPSLDYSPFSPKQIYIISLIRCDNQMILYYDGFHFCRGPKNRAVLVRTGEVSREFRFFFLGGGVPSLRGEIITLLSDKKLMSRIRFRICAASAK